MSDDDESENENEKNEIIKYEKFQDELQEFLNNPPIEFKDLPIFRKTTNDFNHYYFDCNGKEPDDCWDKIYCTDCRFRRGYCECYVDTFKLYQKMIMRKHKHDQKMLLKKKSTCHSCGQIGHWAGDKNCTRYKRKKE